MRQRFQSTALKSCLHAGLVLASLPMLMPMPMALAASDAPPPDGAAIERGAYLAQLGDCAACHTAPGGKSLAGGQEIETPFGVIHSTNITPDVNTGIGGYSFEQFDREVRKGVAADGHNLYPAMPYPSFAKIDQADMRALYAYLMHGVAPVNQVNRDNDLQWPFSMRVGLSLWNMAFIDDQEYKPDPARSAQWNRGAYIIEGLGHCGSCHTPRGLAFQEKTMSADGADGGLFLAGGSLVAWYAPSLRNLWPAPEIAQFLQTGRNRHAAAYGSMTEVVHFSTQHLADTDLAAMAEYLNSLSSNEPAPPPSSAASPAQPMAQALYKTRGGLGYVQFCSACHRLDGRGVAELFPTLADNPAVRSKDPSSVIHVVLSGWKSAETQRYPRSFGMPNFSSLSDQELAEIVTFVRGGWGNQGEAVSPEQIKKIRDQIHLKPQDLGGFATPRFAALLHSGDAERLIYGMRLMTETRALLPGNVGDDLSCTSCHLNGGTVANGSPYVGLAALFPAYQPRAGTTIDFEDRINGCLRRSMNGKPLDKKSAQMLAMVAFVDWMKGDADPKQAIRGRGLGKVSDSFVPNKDNGKLVYQNQCAVCHGEHGEGLKLADGTGVFPPLWGNESFNIGAGIARTYTAAAFVKSNMPIANTLKFPLGQGGLSDQEAVDVAEYFTHMPRPDFPDKVKDWPNGGRPKDAIY